jgi:hypothetical protein
MEFVQFVYDMCFLPYADNPFNFKLKSACANYILPWTKAMGIEFIPTLLDTHPTAKSHVIIELYGGKYTAILPPTPADNLTYTFKLMSAICIVEFVLISIIFALIEYR